MKRFEYIWDDDYYMLHVQLSAGHLGGMTAVVKRVFAGGRQGEPEFLIIPQGMTSHRIMVCRSHPQEQSLDIEYPAEAKLEIFRLDDRAYYPTQAYRTV